jgi:hypothetical protein
VNWPFARVISYLLYIKIFSIINRKKGGQLATFDENACGIRQKGVATFVFKSGQNPGNWPLFWPL